MPSAKKKAALRAASEDSCGFFIRAYTEEPPPPLQAAHMHLEQHPSCEVKKLSAAGYPAILLFSAGAAYGPGGSTVATAGPKHSLM